MGKVAALKIASHQENNSNVAEEGRLLAQLRHPAVVKLHGIIHADTIQPRTALALNLLGDMLEKMIVGAQEPAEAFGQPSIL